MNIKDIKKWFEVAIPEPTTEQACIQIGCHYEEVSEMMDTVGDDFEAGFIKGLSCEYKDAHEPHVDFIGGLGGDERIQLLDDLCDQIVTAVGVAHMLGMDIEGALKEVNDSNHSKFEGGKAVFDGNGKITKGKNYKKPELERFIGGVK